MNMKGFIWAALAATILAYALDTVYYMTMVDMAKMNAQFGALAYTMETMPNPAWYLLYELARVIAIGLVILQRPMSGMGAAMWGGLLSFLMFFVSMFGWVMTFVGVHVDGSIISEGVACTVIGALSAWVMAFVYNKLGK